MANGFTARRLSACTANVFMKAINHGLISPELARGLMSGVSGVADRMGAVMPGIPHYRDGGLSLAGIGGGDLRPVNINLPASRSRRR